MMLVAAAWFFGPAPAFANGGTCGVPRSATAKPKTSDCLYILRASVDVETICSPCLCDVNSSAGVTVTDALQCLYVAVGQLVTLTCPPCEESTTTTSTTTTTTSTIADSCPKVVELTTHAGYGAACESNADCSVGSCDDGSGRCHTASRLAIGWTGAGNGTDLNEGDVLRMRVACESNDAPCGECAVVSVDETSGNCRCASIGGSDRPGLGNQQICNDAFATSSPACPMCENAATKNRSACTANADCVDETPRCSKTSRVCANDGAKTCTANADCGGSANACPAKLCTNDQTKACTVNADCTAVVSTCTNLTCSVNPSKVCATNSDCMACAINAKPTCSTTGTSNLCTSNSDCFIRTGTCTAHAGCNCYSDAPLPLSFGGTPLCVLNRLAGPISGTVHVDEGSGEIATSLRMVVFLGQSGVTNPCPTCGGKCSNDATRFCDRDLDCSGGTCALDPTPHDGQRGGFCTAGQNAGLACDVTATSTVFPSFHDGPGGGGYSLDCFPGVGKNASGTGLVIDLEQTTGSSQLPSQASCQDESRPDLECPCLLCSEDADIDPMPCNTDAQCAALGLGTCSGLGSIGATPQPNRCTDFACTALEDGTGTCTVGPDDTFCEGVLSAGGNGLIPCTESSDCFLDVSDPSTDYRPCGLTQRRGCLPDPIVATGEADAEHPVFAATSCVPPVDGSGKNAAIGLPGPVQILKHTTMRSFCSIDADIPYVPGVGCSGQEP